jgi:hypothetical protein
MGASRPQLQIAHSELRAASAWLSRGQDGHAAETGY